MALDPDRTVRQSIFDANQRRRSYTNRAVRRSYNRVLEAAHSAGFAARHGERQPMDMDERIDQLASGEGQPAPYDARSSPGTGGGGGGRHGA